MSFDRVVLFVCWMLGVLVTSCAPKAAITLPSDPGTPLPDFAAIHTQVSSACAGVRDLQLEIGLSGRAGEEKIGGRVLAGFERPSSMHLEGLPPIGSPVFIFAAKDGVGTLLMTRSREILRNAPPEAILEAMTGVSLDPADLMAVFTGCVLPDAKPIGGTLHAGGWAAIEIESTSPPGSTRRVATLYLQQAGSTWHLRSARRDRWQLDYTAGNGPFPQSVQMVSTGPGLPVNIKASLSQVEPNTGVDPAAFVVNAPKDVTPFTIDDLRRAGPLRGQ